MNDAYSDDGGSGGATAPLPTIDYEPVGIEVDSVASFGEALRLSATNVGTAHTDIKDQLKDPSSDQLGKHSGFPVGQDPAQLTLHDIATKHSERMSDMNTFIGNVQTSLNSLANITAMICSEYTSKDALNGASVDRIETIVKGGEQPSDGTEA